jgi:hypothetical protein
LHPKVRENALHAPTVLNGTHVVAFSTAPDVRTRKGTPRVTAEVVAVFPTGDFLDEWWAGDHAQGDVDVYVSPIARRAQALPPPREVEPFATISSTNSTPDRSSQVSPTARSAWDCLEIGGWRRWKLIRSLHGLP